jgi:cytochrome c-type biogenesis protein CcmH/NrfG
MEGIQPPAPQDDWLRRVSGLRQTLTLCPQDSESRQELAMLLEQLGEMENAASEWREILRRDPNNLAAWVGLARCRGRLKAGRAVVRLVSRPR